MRTLSTIILLLLVWHGPGLGKDTGKTIRWSQFKHPVKFGRISVEDGLSQSSVLCILQDAKGFMWFGTEDGLNKYDGYRFTPYRPQPGNPHSPAANIIFALYEDGKGNLWICTNGGGLNRFDREKEQFIHYRHNPENPGSLSSDIVNCIHEDRQGNLWVGTGGGLNKITPPGKKGEPLTFRHYTHEPGNPHSLSDNIVLSLCEDHRGDLWIGTYTGGLNRMRRTLPVPKNVYLPLGRASRFPAPRG